METAIAVDHGTRAAEPQRHPVGNGEGCGEEHVYHVLVPHGDGHHHVDCHGVGYRVGSILAGFVDIITEVAEGEADETPEEVEQKDDGVDLAVDGEELPSERSIEGMTFLRRKLEEFGGIVGLFQRAI